MATVERSFRLLDAAGAIILNYSGVADDSYIGQVFYGKTVVSVVQNPDYEVPDNTLELRQEAQALEFAQVFKRLDPILFSTLTSAQQTELVNWRKSWNTYSEDRDMPRPAFPPGIFT